MNIEHMIPFSKPRHVGYSLCCYSAGRHVYSLPIDASTHDLRSKLGREYPINCEPLDVEELKKVFPFVIGSIELSWSENFEFLIQGMNLPLDWE
jgi:hypothetical protein